MEVAPEDVVVTREIGGVVDNFSGNTATLDEHVSAATVTINGDVVAKNDSGHLEKDSGISGEDDNDNFDVRRCLCFEFCFLCYTDEMFVSAPTKSEPVARHVFVGTAPKPTPTATTTPAAFWNCQRAPGNESNVSNVPERTQFQTVFVEQHFADGSSFATLSSRPTS